jgi:sulfite reductase (ferredoxin)
MDVLEKELEALGLQDEKFTVRMTGCPNGCARPYNAEVGLVGKAKGKYTVFVGGARIGNRLAFIYKDMVPFEEIVNVLRPLLVAFKNGKQASECFGDFCARLGKEGLEKLTAPEAASA